MSRFENVTVEAKANIYFDGKVVSHSIVEKDGSKKTIGLIYPGTFLFNTGAPEKMIITAGHSSVKKKDETSWTDYPAGTEFSVPGNSSFEIKVESGISEYICLFE
ncbi:MAG: pyrimidine/purine nucleoside phosphorylase [Deltaproteobacteria bacterium]|nr:MAG: pyrimidine/purine nucleoside phosphorylase [Deltaproteobacteria bacterium]